VSAPDDVTIAHTANRMVVHRMVVLAATRGTDQSVIRQYLRVRRSGSTVLRRPVSALIRMKGSAGRPVEPCGRDDALVTERRHRCARRLPFRDSNAFVSETVLERYYWDRKCKYFFASILNRVGANIR
jgi:hypothetical protein